MNPRKLSFQWQTGYSPRPPTSLDQNEILCGGWSSGDSSKVQILSTSIKQFRSCGRGRNLPFLIDLAIGLDKIVISQQIKEVIANGDEKLISL